MSLRGTLDAIHAQAHEEFMAGCDAYDAGDISHAQWKALSDKADETSYAISSYDADHSSIAEAHTPGADTHMATDTSWWDSDGYYHAN